MVTSLAAPTTSVDPFEVVRSATIEPATAGTSVGLEVEAFPMSATGGRIPISAMEPLLRRSLTARPHDGDPRFDLDDAVVSFEPGGQVEIATAPKATISDAIASQLRAWSTLRDVAGSLLVFTGLDLWNDVRSIPLQLSEPRYPMMDRYLTARSRWGRVMMRHSASVQVNLDGGGQLFPHRARVAQALAPFVTASFSTSPTTRAHSGRARVWQRLDPTRTGFLDLAGDPARGMWEMALGADVVVVRRGTTWQAVPRNHSFATWQRDGHPLWGGPTADDIRYHLTTLFPEVRPRHGTLEIRSADSLPLRLLPALVVLVSAAVYDVAAGTQILNITDGLDSVDLWRRAAGAGLEDVDLARLASLVWNVALAGAHSMSTAVAASHLADAGSFVEGWVDRYRSPADELRMVMARDPVRAIDWAGSS